MATEKYLCLISTSYFIKLRLTADKRLRSAQIAISNLFYLQNIKRGIYESNIETERKFLPPKTNRKSGLLKHDKIDYPSFSVCYFHT